MGATWKHKTMFASSFVENNFQNLLNSAGVETYSVDYDINDTFPEVVDQCKNFKVDYIMGYSFGCFPAVACLNENAKGLILVDPDAIVDHTQKKYIEDADTANKFFEDDIKNKNAVITKTLDFSLLKPVKQKTLFLFSEYGYSKNNLDNPRNVFMNIPNKTTSVIPDSSHYVMIEPSRLNAFDTIMEFMNA